MDFYVSIFTASIVMITLWIIYSNAKRIQLKFTIHDVVRLDDLTHYKSNSIISNGNNINNNNNNNSSSSSSSSNLISMSGNSSLLLSNRIRGKPTEYVV
jgi:hypothetical protein